MSSGFMAQFSQARAEVRSMKVAVPYVFPEYQRLKHAERRLAEARAELEDAQRAWNDLGREPHGGDA